MTGYPLLYLAWRSTVNRARVRLRRLREPTYLIAFLLGAAYLSVVFWGGWSTDDSPSMLQALSRGRGGVDFGFTILLFVSAATAWIWPRSGRPALPFSRADVQHLFTAPISRRDLVRYRVLRSQVPALIVSAFVMLIFRPASFGEGGIAFFGLLLLMTTSSLHLTGVSLSRASRGARRWVPRAIAAGAVIVVGTTVAMRWEEITAAAARAGTSVPFTVVGIELDRVLGNGPAAIVLWPFRTLAGLPLSQSSAEFLAALPWVLVLLTLNYIWVVRTDAPFEEGSAELSEKLEELRRRGPTAFRQPRASKRTPFKLAPHGRPETAIVWKNLISMGRFLSWTLLFQLGPIVIFFGVSFAQGSRGRAGVLTFLSLLVALLTLTIGPQLLRGDLRQDLTALSVLKTWPIRGAALVRGEVLAPALVLTTVIVLALISAAVLVPPGDEVVMNRWSWLLAALFVAPGLVLAHLLVQNGLAVTFPAWIHLGRHGGIDVMGQQIIVMGVVVLALIAALVPAVAIAAVGAGVFYLLTGTFPVMLAGLLAGGALLIEAFAASEVLGAILDRSDIAAVDPSETA
jgi:hypothetical protein